MVIPEVVVGLCWSSIRCMKIQTADCTITQNMPVDYQIRPSSFVSLTCVPQGFLRGRVDFTIGHQFLQNSVLAFYFVLGDGHVRHGRGRIVSSVITYWVIKEYNIAKHCPGRRFVRILTFVIRESTYSPAENTLAKTKWPPNRQVRKTMFVRMIIEGYIYTYQQIHWFRNKYEGSGIQLCRLQQQWRTNSESHCRQTKPVVISRQQQVSELEQGQSKQKVRGKETSRALRDGKLVALRQ